MSAASPEKMASLKAEPSEPTPMTPEMRDRLGVAVRLAWILWAQTQPNPKPSWLVSYDKLSEPDKEADRQIGERLFNLGVATERTARLAAEKRVGELEGAIGKALDAGRGVPSRTVDREVLFITRRILRAALKAVGPRLAELPPRTP